jgi:UDP-N-acetylmuramoylalanine-D-glutamate ligase
MPNVEETRATIMNAHQSAQDGLGQLTQAHASLEDSRRALQYGVEGSYQAEADQANAQLAEAINRIEEARQQVVSALEDFNGVAHRM